MSLEYFQRIMQRGDDGVFFPMLVDWRRNQYYDSLIQDTVKDRQCVDVGFGTGLLSLLAIKHGAQHVVAYEQNDDRYELGQYIIDQLGLNDKITLQNYKFDWSTAVEPGTVIISETVGSQLWSEGLWSSMPRRESQTWLPGQVFMEVIAEPVSQAFADDLFRPAEHFGWFNPGVDIDAKFVSLINQLNSKQLPERNEFYHTDNNQTVVWGGWTYSHWAKVDKTPVASYEIDLGQHSISTQDSLGTTWQPIDFDVDALHLTVDLPQSSGLPVLVVPRVGFCHRTSHGNKKLYLDTADSWGAGCTPILVTNGAKRITIEHSVHSGLITYSQE